MLISRLAYGTSYFSFFCDWSFPLSRPVALSVSFTALNHTRASERSGFLPIKIFHGPFSPAVAFHSNTTGRAFRQFGSWRTFLPFARSHCRNSRRSL